MGYRAGGLCRNRTPVTCQSPRSILGSSSSATIYSIRRSTECSIRPTLLSNGFWRKSPRSKGVKSGDGRRAPTRSLCRPNPCAIEMTTNGIPRSWSIGDSADTYAIKCWSQQYFSINGRGNVACHPRGPEAGSIDLKELVDDASGRGISLPLLIRFSDILKSRIVELHAAFERAISEFAYQGDYRGVYPIKVNQHQYVVERIVEMGRPYHYGLEAGSKPELMAVMALLADESALIICNGYKDEEYIETALQYSKLGRTVVVVVEKFSDLELVARAARAMNVRPSIGIRVKLTSKGSGRWEASGGDRSKFGLSARDVDAAVRFLERQGL